MKSNVVSRNWLAIPFAMFVIIWLASLSVGVAAKGYGSEIEPNDTPQQANEIEIGWQNAIINAEITTEDDVDYYKFTACANCTYVIETFNVRVEKKGVWLYDRNGTTLLEEDQNAFYGTGDVSARVIYTFLVSGDYYIKVADDTGFLGNGLGLYSLRVLAKYGEPGAGWNAADDFEPNDVWQLSLPLGIGVNNAVSHEIYENHPDNVTNNNEEDWYRFQAEAGRTYVIQTFDVGTSFKGLWLYDRNGTTVLEDDPNAYNGTGNVSAQVTYSFLVAGTYYIRIADPPSIFDDGLGPYSLRVCLDDCLTHTYLPMVIR